MQELTTDIDKKARLDLHTNNNVLESSFGRLTKIVIKGSVISLTYVGVISVTRRNREFTIEYVYAYNKPKDI